MDPQVSVGRSRSKGRFLFFGLALAFVALIFVELLLLGSTNEHRRTAEWVARTGEILDGLDRLLHNLSDAENGRRGFIISGQDRFLAHHRSGIDQTFLTLTELRRLTAGDPGQSAAWDRLEALIHQRLAISTNSILSRVQNGFDPVAQTRSMEDGQRAMESIRSLVAERTASERRRLDERKAFQDQNVQGTEGFAVLVSLLGIALFAVLFALFRSAHRQQRKAEDELHRANLDLDRRVTERTAELSRLVAQLEEADEFRGCVLECAQFGLFAVDPEGRLTLANAQFGSLTGHGAGEILDQSFERFFAPAAANDLKAHFAQVLKDRKHVSQLETDLLRKDGSVVRVVSSWSPLLAHQRVRGAVGAVVDISERKRAEERLRAQLDRLDLLSRTTRAIGERQDLPSIVHVVLQSLEDHLSIDLACAFKYDPVARHLLLIGIGQRSAHPAAHLGIQPDIPIEIGENGLARCVRGDLVHEPDLATSSSPFPQRLAAHGFRSLVIAPLVVHREIFGVLVAARRAAGSFSSGECEFLRQLSEHVGLAAHHARLYSDLQTAYDDLRQTQQTVLQQERLRALGQMASGLAHDINNAIVPVAVYCDLLLEKEPLSPAGKEQLGIIQRAAHDVGQTVARMGEFYRHREAQEKNRAIDLNLVMTQVVELTRVRWSDMPLRRGAVIEVRTELAPDLPPVSGIDSELREAFVNLVFNAVDAMASGGTLTLRTRLDLASLAPDAHPPSAGSVVAEVADTGCGMDEECRRRCLEPFFTTKGERGSGLGLAMVYGIAQRHQAALEIESAPELGTTVRLRFPPASPGAHPPDPPPPPVRTPRPRRILIVDDDPLVARALVQALESDGHRVVSHNDGQAGIEAFLAAHASQAPFELVITDLGMPHIDGRQVAQAVKSASPRTPVILQTGWGQRLDAEGSAPEHVDVVLGKPATLAQLREALERACTNSQQP